MENPPNKSLIIQENLIITLPSKSQKKRRNFYLIFLILYLIAGAVAILAMNERAGRWLFLLLCGLPFLLNIFYPLKRGKQSLEVKNGVIKRKPSYLFRKRSFEISKINQVAISNWDIETGFTVYINYDSEGFRYNMIESFNEEDAEKVKSWVEGKLNQIEQ